MENKKVSINLVSHNINGFSGSESYLNMLCEDDSNSILCIQEHWLRPAYKNLKSINQLRTVHDNFDGYGVSAMKSVHNDAILKGRPYGGTGFLFKRDFSSFLQPVLMYESERVSVMKLNDVDFTILLINVYFPYKQNSDEHRVQYLEVLGTVESILLANPMAKFIITGDFNYDIYDSRQLMSNAIHEFLDNYDLLCTHELDPSFNSDSSYTRCCMKSETYSLLDYIFISSSLRDRVKRCQIRYDGRNPSDHFPVSLQLDVVPMVTGDAVNTGSNLNNNRISWSKISCDELVKYEKAMEEMLDSLVIPSDIVHGNKLCFCDQHIHQINSYYHSLISVLEVADSLLPRKSPHGKRGKDFWTETLSQLKRESVEAYDKWTNDGRPSSGPSYEHKKDVHYRYKAELRRRRRMMAAERSEALGNDLMDKNFVGFWRDWKRLSQTKCPPVNRIGDATQERDIASVFLSYFQGIYGSNDTDAHHQLQHELANRFPSYLNSGLDESISPFFLSWNDMITISGKLKEGKSSTTFLTAEHILHGSPKLAAHLHLLFNAFIQHSFVPIDFLNGTISPVVKNSSGDLHSTDNYRGVTLSSVLALMFENGLRLKFGSFLSSHDLQFGFKPKHSVNHAVFTLKSCVNYFTERGSSVYVAFLDYSKAFDTISHSGLFLKLMDRKVPLCFLLIIMFWYLNMEYNVKWAKVRSNSFRVLCGTKQGGILSPDFFAVYINDLIIVLKEMGIGCHMINFFIACLLFADDMSLIAPTREALQRMIDVCAAYCSRFCLKFNVAKTKVMVFGKLSRVLPSLAKITIHGEGIEYVNSCKYLGFHLVSHDKFKFSVIEDLRGFFGSVNSVLTSIHRPRENVLMQLLYSNCVPKLTFGAPVKELTAAEMNQFNVAVNTAVRRIFGFRQWQSIRHLRDIYCYDSIEVMFDRLRKRFFNGMISHDNETLKFLAALQREAEGRERDLVP